MFWSKLWLFLITLAAGVAVAVALLAPRPLAHDLEREAGARLERAQHAASLLLKVNARKWMDTAAQVAGDAVLVESLDQATRDQASKGGDLNLVHRTVQERLRYFNDKMKVDLVIATDGRGRVIARAGLDESVFRDGVEGFPLVADALRGLRGDDTWALDGKLYRVAASPVIARDRYAGALVVGQEVGGELAQSMKQVLDVDVAFLLRGRVLASSVQLPVLARLPVVLDQQAAELARAGHSMPLALDSGDKSWMVVLAPFVGEAAGHKAAYALVLARPGAASLPALVSQLVATDPKTLPWVSLAPVGGAVLLALILGLLLLRLESDRPLKRLLRDAQALARGEVQRLDDDRHPGKLGTVARAVNTTLDRIGTSPASGRSSAGEERGRSTLNSTESLRPPLSQTPPLGGLSPAADKPGQFEEQSNPGPGERRGSETPIFEPPPELVAKMQETHSHDPEPTPLTSPKMQLQSLLDTDAQVTNVAGESRAAGGSKDDGPDLIDAPGMGLPPLVPAPDKPLPPRRIQTPYPAAAPQFGEDEPTMASAAASPPARAQPTAEEQALDTELQQVFHDFIETKQRLGEPTEGVTYEKFVVKLKANRMQLITRYACKSVKFQVYIKDGKAALKATPVQA